MTSTLASLIWPAILTGAAGLFVSPVIAAIARRTEGVWLVTLVAMTGLVTGGAGWLAAWYVMLRAPRRPKPTATGLAGLQASWPQSRDTRHHLGGGVTVIPPADSRRADQATRGRQDIPYTLRVPGPSPDARESGQEASADSAPGQALRFADPGRRRPARTGPQPGRPVGPRYTRPAA